VCKITHPYLIQNVFTLMQKMLYKYWQTVVVKMMCSRTVASEVNQRWLLVQQ